jgi:predicted permease
MTELGANLLRLYVPLLGIGGLGLLLGYKLPPRIPQYLGKFLFWGGVPLSIFAFLRQSDLSESVWLAPVIAWVAMLTGAGLAWAWIWLATQRNLGQRNLGGDRPSLSEPPSLQNRPAQGSFVLAAMVGNTGYLGYPVALAVVGPTYFGWAIFYDTLGSTLGAYGLGVLIAARLGASHLAYGALARALLINPALWSFGLGLLSRDMPLPLGVEQGLQRLAWGIVMLALLLLGMRLSQLQSWSRLAQAAVGLSIKMVLVPLGIGVGLLAVGLPEPARLVLVLQMAMPPAFATLVIAEAYDLDRELTVTALALGSGGLFLTLPVWLLLF